jgi:hypothetical protein
MKECDNSTRKIHISSNFILSISLLIMFDTLLLTPTLHCNTPLHFTTLHPTTLHYTSLHFTTLHPSTLHYTYRHFTTSHFHYNNSKRIARFNTVISRAVDPVLYIDCISTKQQNTNRPSQCAPLYFPPIQHLCSTSNLDILQQTFNPI